MWFPFGSVDSAGFNAYWTQYGYWRDAFNVRTGHSTAELVLINWRMIGHSQTYG